MLHGDLQKLFKHMFSVVFCLFIILLAEIYFFNNTLLVIHPSFGTVKLSVLVLF